MNTISAAAGNQESEDSLIAQRRRIREEWAKKKQKQEADIVAIHVPDVIRTPLVTYIYTHMCMCVCVRLKEGVFMLCVCSYVRIIYL
jgi:hypothetical protein